MQRKQMELVEISAFINMAGNQLFSNEKKKKQNQKQTHGQNKTNAGGTVMHKTRVIQLYNNLSLVNDLPFSDIRYTFVCHLSIS